LPFSLASGKIWNGYKTYAPGTEGTNESIVANEDLQIFPNPATDKVNIRAESPILRVRAYNHLGQFIIETKGDA
jgi:hypothetical protein